MCFSTSWRSRFWLLVVVSITLAGCATKQVQSPQVAIPKPGNMLNLDRSELDEQQIFWLDEINRFYQADMQDVVIPHVKVVNQLDDWPQDSYCSPQHVELINRAIELNATSLLALTFRSFCADLAQNAELAEETQTALGNISEILLLSGNGRTPEQAVQVRDLYEVNIIFQWAGLDVFDIELLRLHDQVVYKFHTFAMTNGQYDVYYAKNSQYVAKNLQQSGQPIENPQALADIIIQGNINAKDASALQWQYAQWLRQDQPQKVIEALSTQSDLRFLAEVLLVQAYLHVNDQRSINYHLDNILSFSEAGFVEASAVFGQHLLNSDDPMDLQGAANLYRVNVEQHGIYNAAMAWLESFLRLPPQPQQFERLLDQFDEADYVGWRLAINQYDHVFGGISEVGYQKLTLLLEQLGQHYVRAQLDYAALLLEGKWQNEAKIEAGLAIIRDLAHQGDHNAQLDYGILHSKGRYGIAINREAAFDWYFQSAQQGNSSALYNLGLAYRFARGVEKDMQLSVDYFQQAYDAGFDLAGCRVGDIYSEEQEVMNLQYASAAYQAVLDEKDSSTEAKASCAYGLGYIEFYQNENTDQALDLFQRAGDWGEENAYFELGLIYEDGTKVTKDPQRAVEYYLQAINMGSYRAAANLGYMYETGNGVSRDLQKALRFYTISANGGSPTGQNNLATFYRYGQVVEQNIQTAFDLYLKSYAKGNRFAAENLGDMYYFGELGEPDYQTACNYYEAAVARGAADVQFDVAYCFVYGEGREQNVDKGVALLLQSALNNDTSALVELGRLYANGELVEQDLQKSLRYYQSAYELNNPRAAYALGLNYENGIGVKKDPVLSFEYYRQSASWGMTEGMLATAKAYLYGFGTAKDKEQAIKWLQKASQKGSMEAQSLLKNL
ncbi:tetratricopeptide repeat protein [Aliiglaciecola litoralis]|uniref:Sel1 repeat family protein n=1 Tax=Aliiglaciecola litoralis TaxID=582857 RepID=A0ABN1LQP5_9ALTE